MKKLREIKNPMYLLVTEQREHGYFHLRAAVVTQKYEHNAWIPYGIDDDYSDGLLWSGLRVNCQGDRDSQVRDREPVYGFATEYRDVFSIDVRKARRMLKTLERIERNLNKLSEVRGYVRNFGEYLGRVAEALDCSGIAFQRTEKTQEITGQQYEWMNIGDGVNRANHRVYLWQQEAKETARATA